MSASKAILLLLAGFVIGGLATERGSDLQVRQKGFTSLWGKDYRCTPISLKDMRDPLDKPTQIRGRVRIRSSCA
jgi:hypothetical protein